MAKQVTVSRQETELTVEQAKQFILDKVFEYVSRYFMVGSFLGRVRSAGLEESQASELEKLVNELIDEGKLQIRFDYIASFMSGPGSVVIIKRIA